MANENGYYMLMYAIIEQAINDYLSTGYKDKVPKEYEMTEEDLEKFLHNMFSDDSYVQRFMRGAKKLKAEGCKKIGGNYGKKE